MIALVPPHEGLDICAQHKCGCDPDKSMRKTCCCFPEKTDRSPGERGDDSRNPFGILLAASTCAGTGGSPLALIASVEFVPSISAVLPFPSPAMFPMPLERAEPHSVLFQPPSPPPRHTRLS